MQRRRRRHNWAGNRRFIYTFVLVCIFTSIHANTNCLYSIHTNLLTPYWSVLVCIRLYWYVLNCIICMYWFVLNVSIQTNTNGIHPGNTCTIQTNTDTIRFVCIQYIPIYSRRIGLYWSVLVCICSYYIQLDICIGLYWGCIQELIQNQYGNQIMNTNTIQAQYRQSIQTQYKPIRRE